MTYMHTGTRQFPHVAVVERNAGNLYRMHGTAATCQPPDTWAAA